MDGAKIASRPMCICRGEASSIQAQAAKDPSRGLPVCPLSPTAARLHVAVVWGLHGPRSSGPRALSPHFRPLPHAAAVSLRSHPPFWPILPTDDNLAECNSPIQN